MVQRYNPDYVMHAARFAPFARENEHGEFVKFSHYEILKAERDALAVENAALKVAVDGFNQELYGKGFEVLGWHLNGDTEPLDNWFGENDWNPETPATDAALAAIRNEATARALKHLCDCQLISATVAELKADELREAK